MLTYSYFTFPRSDSTFKKILPRNIWCYPYFCPCMEQEIVLIKRGGCWLVPSLISTDCWSLTVSTKHETLKQSSPRLSLFQVLLLLPKSTFNMNVLVFPLYACELIFEIVSSALNHHFSPDCCHYQLQTKYLFISKYPK